MHQSDLDGFVDALRDATSSVEKRYFDFAVSGRKAPAYRERVYCYELYHQLRCRLGPEFRYALCGEVDKRGHPLIRPYIPDFVVHIPGDMDSNLAVVEVKSAKGGSGILRDLKKLSYFVTEGPAYKLGVYLVYGQSPRGIERFKSECINFLGDRPFALNLMWHLRAGERSEIISLEHPEFSGTGR
jgi:hypothetical protein